MQNCEKLITLGKRIGFSHVVALAPSTIEVKEEVRQMCSACHQYGTRWSCPPGCGTLEECRAKIAAYPYGILVQTVGELEDAFDGEGIFGRPPFIDLFKFFHLYLLLRLQVNVIIRVIN